MRHFFFSSPYEWLWTVAILVAGIVLWLRRHPRDSSEAERHRRMYLNRVGRIIEGQVMEIIEQAAPASKPPRRDLFRRDIPPALDGRVAPQTLVFYSYRISGVGYESAQDVSGLEERACIRRVVMGQPASVKYDPANPGNSILVSDDWSGLR
jgi:hypothetical protein